MSSKELRVAGAQIPVGRDVDQNVAVILRAIEFARQESADILLTPEGSLSGYSHEFDSQDVCAGLAVVITAAREAKVALALGTCFEEPDGLRYNQVRLYDRAGDLIGWHSKILICSHVGKTSEGSREEYASQSLKTFEFEGNTVGALVCNDMWANPEWTPQNDPHLSLQLSKMGARTIFVAVNAGVGEGSELELNRQYHESNLRLRARSGQQWFVVADAADPDGKRASMSPSGVVDPTGNWALKVEPIGEKLFAFTIPV